MQAGILSAGMLLPAKVDTAHRSLELSEMGRESDTNKREGSKGSIIPTHFLEPRASPGWAL